jgi:hypothetical protein
VYITGHRVGGVGPYHTALEYDPGTGPIWTSAHTPEGRLDAGLFGDPITSGVGSPFDAPANNITIGTVTPPAGMSPGEYFSSVLSASAACCGNLDYALFPSRIFDGYNSNGFISGLVQATGGTPSVDFARFVGGGHPIPPRYFGR